MNHTEFFASVAQGIIAACYLFEGTEELIKRSALTQLQDAVSSGEFAEMNYTRLIDPPPDVLIATAETLPFLCEKRLVEVRNSSLLLKNAKTKDYDENDAAKTLDAYLSHIPETTCIVFYVPGKADSKKKFYNSLKKHAVIVTFDPLQEGELTKWIGQRFRKLGKTISGTVCQQLWFTAGNNLTMLDLEISKLAAYTGDRNEVTEEDVRCITTQTIEYKVFDLADTLFSGQAGKALTMLKALLREGTDQLMIVPLLGRQCRQMRFAKALGAEGAQANEIAQRLGIPFFAAKKTIASAQRYSIHQLNEMIQLCLDGEYKVKSGQWMEDGLAEKVLLQILSIRKG